MLMIPLNLHWDTCRVTLIASQLTQGHFLSGTLSFTSWIVKIPRISGEKLALNHSASSVGHPKYKEIYFISLDIH